jgi:hypothetical protein
MSTLSMRLSYNLHHHFNAMVRLGLTAFVAQKQALQAG